MEWDKFIDEKREQIDELIGPNQEQYALISLKGILITPEEKETYIKIMKEEFIC